MLQFVREIPIRIQIQKASSGRRGFLFYFAAGFEGPLDPLSGMSANLVSIDGWLKKLKASLEDRTFVGPEEALVLARKELSLQATTEHIRLVSLEMKEQRSGALKWQQESSFLTWTSSHYLEFFPVDDRFELCRLEFVWKKAPGCEEDYLHEGFKVLKGLQVKSWADLISALGEAKGLRLVSGSELFQIGLHGLAGGFQLVI